MLVAVFGCSSISIFAQPVSPAAREPDEVVTLPEFAVTTALSDDRVVAEESLGATRVASKQTEIPIPVTVLKPEFLENFQLYHLDEQLPYVAGYLAGEVEAGTTGGGRLRGFSPPTFRNGFRRAGVGEVVNVDRVEVIKGPLSAMVGNSSPGGIVNYITRRPQRKPGYAFKAITGSYDYYRLEAHATGPAVTDKLFYRVDAARTYNEGITEFFFIRSNAASAALTYQLSHDTSLTIEAERLEYKSNPGQGGLIKNLGTAVSPVTGTSLASVVGGVPEALMRRGFNVWGPDAEVTRRTNTFDLRAEHRLRKNVILRANLQFWTWDYQSYRWTSPNYIVATGLFAARAPFSQTQPRDGGQGQVDVLTSFETGPAKHRLLVTLDASEINEGDQQYQFQTASVNALPAATRTLNPANPSYSGYDRSLFTRATRQEDSTTRLVGLLLSDRVALLKDRLMLYGSARVDQLNVDYLDRLTPANSAKKDVRQESYSLGFSAKLAGEKLVFFANRSTAFDPQTTIDRGTGELQDNVTARGYDVGFKGALEDKGLYYQAMVYRIDREDIPQRNPDFDPAVDVAGSGVSEFIGAGAERSEGWEVEVFGDLSDSFSFTAAIGHVDARTTASLNDPASVGMPLLRVPKMNYSLSGRYRMRSGMLAGLSFGASLRYTDDYVARYGTFGSEITGTGVITKDLRLHYGPNNRVEEIRPEATLVNFFVNYGFKLGRYRHTVGLNINNVFDEEWWTVTGRQGVEREFRVSYGLKF